MTHNTKSLLIVAGVAVGAWLLYNYFTRGRLIPNAISNPGSGQSVAGSTAQGAGGSADFWSTLGNVGKGLNSAVSTVEADYNKVYDLFGGGSTSTPSGVNQGQNP